jgi:quercetin dioxygenase-like cupin family protein
MTQPSPSSTSATSPTSSAYKASPRPTFERATPIPYAAATRHLWGDAESGEVADWIYVSSDKIHSLVYGLPPRGWFRHSDSYRTIFGADVTYHVLSGVMVIANPANGEVHRVMPGETAYFGPDTWHHVYNYSDEPLRVLEFFAPPPSTGTSGAYARTKPLLTTTNYTRDQLLGHLPNGVFKPAAQTLHIVRAGDILWRLEGTGFPMMVGLIVATADLTVGQIALLPGQHSDVQTHGGDEAIYIVEGVLNIRVHDGQRPNWFELNPGDECYLPAGTPHEYYSTGATPVKAVFGVAPRYLP